VRPIFFVGNKRSGTSVLNQHINFHPNIFSTNESNVAWLAFQATMFQMHEVPRERLITDNYPDGSCGAFAPHPLDAGSAGPMWTLRALRGTTVLADDVAPRQRWENIQRGWYDGVAEGRIQPPFGAALRRLGLPDWGDLTYLGDKNPTVDADPEVLEWIAHQFPDARLIHIYRHPAYVIGSMRKLGFHPWWRASNSVEDQLVQWAEIEEWAFEAEQSLPVFHLKHESLLADTEFWMYALFEWLDLDPVRVGQTKFRTQTEPVSLESIPKEAKSMMRSLGYSS
jgi:hypothetical protein